MKALKRLSISTTIISAVAMTLNGLYNTAQVNDKSFFTVSYGIKFEKRLDEVEGRLTVARNAASITEKEWNQLEVEKQESQNIVKISSESSVAENGQEQPLASPAIVENMELSLSNVFYNRPLLEGEFSGSAKTSGGVIEEIYVNLPDGNVIEINTREPMAGNVFQYEDSVTREMKSAMFYEVKQGVYMVTLTNDEKYAGVRMEFTAQNGAQLAYSEQYYEDTRSWNMNSQNYEQNALQDNNVDHYEQLVREQEMEQVTVPQTSFSFGFQS